MFLVFLAICLPPVGLARCAGFVRRPLMVTITMRSEVEPGRAARLQAPVIAALLMVGMALCYATTANVARLMAEELNATMIALLRNGFCLVVLLPMLIRVGPAILRTSRPGLHVLRSLFNLTSMLAWFWALPYIVLADGVALMFTAPLFGALGAVLLLGERLGPAAPARSPSALPVRW
jgi:drug/metabolite transporter (DMT)-like permease